MKIIVVLISLLFSLYSWAEDSSSCVGLNGLYHVQFKGFARLRAHKTYFLNLIFETGRTGFTFESNYRDDVRIVLDVEQISLQRTSFYSTAALENITNCTDDRYYCKQRVDQVMTALSSIRKNALGTTSPEASRALSCAYERALQFRHLFYLDPIDF